MREVAQTQGIWNRIKGWLQQMEMPWQTSGLVVPFHPAASQCVNTAQF